MFKSVITVMLTIVLALSLTACGGGEAAAPETTVPETTVPVTTAAPTTEPTTEHTTVPTEPPKPWLDNVLMPDPNVYPEPLTMLGISQPNRPQMTEITFLDTLADMPEDAWDVSEAKNGSVMAWVDGTHLYIAGEGGVSAPPDSSYLFGNYENVTAINFNGNFHTENAENMWFMFGYCKNLENLDLSGFDTAKVTDMSDMFSSCFKLKELNISGWNTAQVTDMKRMFINCNALLPVDLSSFDTSNVTDMNGMFCECKALTSVDMSSFDTSKVTDMNSMFDHCFALENVELGDWETDSVENYERFLPDNIKINGESWRNLFTK